MNFIEVEMANAVDVDIVSETTPIDVIQVNGKEISDEDILAELCVEAEKLSVEVRNCLRVYNLKSSTKHLKSLFNPFKKSVIVESLKFLNVSVANWNKDVCIHELICRIQNLLIDKCQFCSCNYATGREQKLLLQCHLCGQNMHDKCLKNLLGEKFTNDLTLSDVNSIINPFNISTMHFLCGRCSKETIPQAMDSNDCVKSTPTKDVPENITSSETDPKLPISPDTNLIQKNKPNKSKLCHFYARGTCKHGKEGINCKYDHPTYCQLLLSHGRTSRKGCDKGDECKDFHPKMCYSSLRKHECYNDRCPFFHVKGTKRVAPESKKSHTQYHSSQSSKGGESSGHQGYPCSVADNGPTTNDFLVMFNRLRADLFQALDSRMTVMLRSPVYQGQNVLTQDQAFHQQHPNYQPQAPVLPQVPGLPPAHPSHWD